ncbi:MAG: endonuclease III domain-containing protein, partial [Candidatus Omnitrophica bacterium]|nr:endonuclease III domain-containing protein [Candidatus Omnitrophota bacterium]
MKQGRHRISLSDLPGLMEVYSSLRERFGHRDWWPGDTPFEIIVGAILTQNTAWKNVEKAIANLKREKVLSVAAMRRIPQDRLAELIRSSGYFNQKAIK